MEICVYCGQPIVELPQVDGVPLHSAFIDGWIAQEMVYGPISTELPTTTTTKKLEKTERFTRDLLVGSFFKNIAATLFNNAGYEVFPFGYESFLAGLKRPLSYVQFQQNSTAERIRSTPDLVVLDKDNRSLHLKKRLLYQINK